MGGDLEFLSPKWQAIGQLLLDVIPADYSSYFNDKKMKGKRKKIYPITVSNVN